MFLPFCDDLWFKISFMKTAIRVEGLAGNSFAAGTSRQPQLGSNLRRFGAIANGNKAVSPVMQMGIAAIVHQPSQ
jgi:hypothetical protein